MWPMEVSERPGDEVTQRIVRIPGVLEYIDEGDSPSIAQVSQVEPGSLRFAQFGITVGSTVWPLWTTGWPARHEIALFVPAAQSGRKRLRLACWRLYPVGGAVLRPNVRGGPAGLQVRPPLSQLYGPCRYGTRTSQKPSRRSGCGPCSPEIVWEMKSPTGSFGSPVYLKTSVKVTIPASRVSVGPW